MTVRTLFLKCFAPYKLSQNRELYEHIAGSYLLTPNRVYKIAHGKRPKNFNESQAYRDLVNNGIIVEK